MDENGRTGVVTLRALLDVQNIATAKLPSVMSFVPRLGPANTIGDAATLMFEYRLRSLPYFENGNLKGRVTTSPIIESLTEAQPDLSADRLMTPDPICVDARDEVAKARRIMLRRKVDQLPVTKDGKLQSVITSSSIVFNLMPVADRQVKGNWRVRRYEAPVEDISTEGVVQNDAKDNAREVFQNMSKNLSTYSVITNFDEIQGIITHRDFMKMILNAKDSGSIPMYIVGLPDDPFEAEATREKFTRVIQLVRKSIPNVIEARAIIRAGETKAARKRFRVQVFILTPRQHYSYTVSGFELPDMFDEISRWSKKLAERNDSRRRRVRVDPGTLA